MDQNEEFKIMLDDDDFLDQNIKNWLIILPLEQNHPDADGMFVATVQWTPMKPLQALAPIKVTKSTGGVWK